MPQHSPQARPQAFIQGDHWRVTVLFSGLVRIEYSPDNQFEDRASTFAINRQTDVPNFKATKTDTGGLELVTATLRLSYDGKPFSPSGLHAHGVFTHFVGHLATGTPEWRFGQVDAGNMGGTVRTLDFTTGKVDTGYGIISKTGISMLDDSLSMLFTDDGWITMREPGRSDIYLFCFGANHRAALQAFYAVSGPALVLPRWSLGNWWSKYYPYRQDEYLALMDRFREEEIPLSVAVLDMEWHLIDIPPEDGEGWTGYTWNQELFPDHVDFMAKLHDRDLKITANVHPVDGVRSFEQCYERLCKALGRDPAKGDPVHFDPTDRNFLEAYLTEVHHPLEDEGCDFWWLDWQQGKFSRIAGVDPLWILNHYHFLDSQRRLGRRMTFSRWAGPGNQRYPIGFSGDTEILWSVLQFQPEFTITAANIGFGWWSHDIGGHHHGITDDDLMSRWIQFGLFAPILRLHSNDNTTIVREPWLRGAECQKIMTECLQFRHRMIPYLYTMSVRATLEGRSLVEPMYYDHPSHPYAYRNKNEYLFGSAMIVCPITTPKVFATNMGKVECWLPPGRYVDIFTGTVYDGNRVFEMHRPTTQIPVLSGAGSIFPLNNEANVDTTNGAPIPTSLEVVVTVGVDAEFTIMEDDGTAEDVEHISFAKTPITYTQSTGQVSIGPTEQPLVDERAWCLNLPAFPLDHLDSIVVEVAGKQVRAEIEQTKTGVQIHLPNAVNAKDHVVVSLGQNLRLRSNNLLAKVQEIVARAQIEHDTKHEILTHVKADISRSVLVSRIAATEMDSDMRSALMEFIVADDFDKIAV